MRRFFKNIIVFGFFLGGLFFLPFYGISLFDNFDKNWNDNSNVRVISQIPQNDSLDILFLGNSYCKAGIISNKFDSVGLKVFNLGISTGGPIFYDLVSRDYLKQVKASPKIVFLLLSPTTFSSKTDFFQTYPIHRYLNEPVSNLNLFLNYNPDDKVAILKNSFKKGLKNLFQKKPPAPKQKTKQVEDPSRKSEKEIERLYKPFKDNSFDMEKVEQLFKTISLFEKHHVKVVFYELPTNKLYSFFNSQFLEDFSKFKEELKSTFEVLEIDSTLFDQSDFRDIDHLNKKGGQKATNLIIEEILNKS